MSGVSRADEVLGGSVGFGGVQGGSVGGSVGGSYENRNCTD